MPEKIEELVRAALAAAQDAGDLPAFDLEDCGVERPADTSHGEWTSTMALKSAKFAHCAPKKIADAVCAHMPADPVVEKVEVAGPGFINFYLSAAAKNAVFAEAREQGMDFARSNVGGGLKTQVEFVSANPVGPMHVGHGRWAALGDSMCRVMSHAGYDIQREFWINDYGNQMNTFGNSISKRYMQLADIMEKQGCDIDAARDFLAKDRDNFVQDEADEHPDSHPYMDDFTADLGKDSYGGTYIIDEAAAFWKSDGDKWVDADPQERMLSFRERGYQKMLKDMRETCHDVRCDFDVWMSERTMYQKDWTGTSPVERAYAKLDEMGYLYRTDDGALWFKSTAFGDDKDRVIQKSNGDYTYFSSDIAYHWNKFQRVDHVIDIWGADHHGYIARVRAVCDALGYPGQFEVPLGQFVNLLRSAGPYVQAQGHDDHVPRAHRRGRCRRRPLHARLPLLQPDHRLRHRCREGEEPVEPRVLRAVCPRPHLLHPAQGCRRYQGAGRPHGHGGRRGEGRRQRRQLLAAHRPHRARALPQALRAAGPHRWLRP